MRKRTRLHTEALDDRCLPSFSPAVNYPVGSTPAAVATGDFNNDGHLDLATANDYTDTVSVLLGNGNGTFQSPLNSAASSAPRSLAVGDINADGNLDLAMVNAYMLGGWNGYEYTPGAEESNGVSVLLGNGDGRFQAPLNVPLSDGTKATSVAVGDLNNDGAMDLTVASTTDPYYPGDVYEDFGLASVLLSNGDGSFQLQDGRWVDLGYGWSRPVPAAVGVAVADFNGDGNQDFVVGTRDYGWEINDTVQVVAMLLGDGQGNIAQLSHWRLDHGGLLAAGDVNGDGDADLVTAIGTDVRVRLGNGAGGFDAPPNGVGYPAGIYPRTVVLGDFIRDGKLDIATANHGSNNVSVLRGLGGGTFSEPEHFIAGPGDIAVTAGDFDGDGWLDAATANYNVPSASVLINDRIWGTIPPSVSVGNATVTEGDAGTVNANFTVTLSKSSAVDVTVYFSTADITAEAGSDYIARSGSVTIRAGQTSGTITIPVLGDYVAEPNETFAVNLSAATNAMILDGLGIGTIMDDEPRVNIHSASVTEGNIGTINATFTVSLSRAAIADVTVQYQTVVGGSASAGSDYEPTFGTVTIPAGQTSATFTVPVIGDRLVEQNEYFWVYLSAPTNAILNNGWGSGTILDDEPRISINDVSKREGRTGKTTLFTFTVKLSVAYDQPVTMSFQTVDGTATTSDNDYVTKSGTLTFAPGETTKTITITVNGDKTKEATEYFYLDLFGLSGNSLLTKNRGTGTIVNDD